MVEEQSGSSSKGEPPFNWRLATLPCDVRMVLRLRTQVKTYMEAKGIKGLVADLLVEQDLLNTKPAFRVLSRQINQPITFGLPTWTLKILSKL